jgi:hypothetical protein
MPKIIKDKWWCPRCEHFQDEDEVVILDNEVYCHCSSNDPIAQTTKANTFP